MIIFYILFVVLVVSRLRFIAKGFHTDYLSFDTTNAIKGIFILLVFIKHATPYIFNSGYIYEGWSGKVFHFIDGHVGQWIVAMFLFYSGYGMMESIAQKGQTYIASIPRRRVLTTLINFDIAVLAFIIIGLLYGKIYPPLHYILSFTGWESVGNSNWYIFVILLCYTITYLSFSYTSMHICKKWGLCFILLIISVIILSYFKQGYWYDTMLCFGVGMLYSMLKERIEFIIQRNYWCTLCLLTILLIITSHSPLEFKGFVYNSFAIVFCATIITISMKLKVNSQILVWCGKNLFPLYIYQRIPMIALSSVWNGILPSTYPVLYVTLCMAITLVITYFYKYWAVKL